MATLTVARRLSDELPAYVRHCVELDEAGFQPKELEPGDRILLLDDEQGIVVRAQEVALTSWESALTTRRSGWSVWAPKLEVLVAKVQELLGKDVDLELHRYSTGDYSVGAPRWRLYGIGEDYSAAAADLLVEILHQTCPHCGAISEGRRAHDRLADGRSCPAFEED